MRIGTSSNPIKPVSESTPRKLLLKHCKNTSIGFFDFHSLPNFGNDTYILNVLFNSHLSPQEVKFAIYFHEELSKVGKVFSTSSGNFCPANEYGEGFIEDGKYCEGVVIGGIDSIKQITCKTNEEGYFPSLMCLADSMGMKLTPQGMTKLVRRLHDFGYITVTDITPANTYTPPALHKKTEYRARLRYIRLCEGMRWKDISARWLSKATVKRLSTKTHHDTQV